jgi:hypothetical protein
VRLEIGDLGPAENSCVEGLVEAAQAISLE